MTTGLLAVKKVLREGRASEAWGDLVVILEDPNLIICCVTVMQPLQTNKIRSVLLHPLGRRRGQRLSATLMIAVIVLPASFREPSGGSGEECIRVCKQEQVCTDVRRPLRGLPWTVVWESPSTVRRTGSLTEVVEKGVRVLPLARWQLCISLSQLLATPGEELPLTRHRVTPLDGDAPPLQRTKNNERV